ncbi:transferase [Campylobacter jejuni]|nr:transferase [Campylobacter jejuni]
MKNVIIIGAGGFTRELYSYLKDANYEIIGYICKGYFKKNM